MAKNYLMVSLEDSESKQLAQVLSNDTSRAIMKYMTEHERVTETEIASAMDIPLSTVHYNIQNLVNAGLVKATEFHYSKKGKEVMHYTLSNKIIVIAPKKERGLNFLKRILPVAALIGVAAVGLSRLKAPAMMKTATFAAPLSSKISPPFYTSIVLWFVIGAALALFSYVLLGYKRKK